MDMYSITQDFISNHRKTLIALSHFDEYDIQRMWRLANEKELDGFSDLKYSNESPLFHKMIFRFWQADRSPSTFWNQLTLPDQLRILLMFDLLRTDHVKLMNFFVWMANGINIETMLHICREHLNHPRVSGLNEISLYFFLSPVARQKLIDFYNKSLSNGQHQDEDIVRPDE